jgi:hypothetical protein
MFASPVLVNELSGIGIVTRQVGTRTRGTSCEHALSWIAPNDISAPRSWVTLLPRDELGRFWSKAITVLVLLFFFSILGMAISMSSAGAAAPRNEFRYYPAFTDQSWRASRSGIEMATDKGLVVEFVVRCPKGVGVMTYSKLENVYCSSGHQCMASLDDAIRSTCR